MSEWGRKNTRTREHENEGREESQKLRLDALTIRVLRTGHARAQIRIVVPHAAVHAVPHTLIHADRDVVGAAHVEVDEETAVGLLGDAFEQFAEVTGDREASVLWCYCHRGDVAMPVGIVAFRLANDCVFLETVRR